MSSYNYAKVVANATKAIKKYGLVATITKLEARVSTIPWENSGRAAVEESGLGVIGEYSARDYANTSIEMGDVRLFLSPQGISRVRVTDLVSLDSITYKVIDVSVIQPGGVDVLYDVQLRK